MLLICRAKGIRLSVFMAALMGVIMMLFVVNVFVLMHLSIMIMSMGVFFPGMTAHLFSPPILLSQYKSRLQPIKALLLSIIHEAV